MSNLDIANQIVYKFTMKKIFQKKCQVIYINIANPHLWEQKKMATTFGKQVLRTPHIYNILITNCNSKTKNCFPKVVYLHRCGYVGTLPPPPSKLLTIQQFSDVFNWSKLKRISIFYSFFSTSNERNEFKLILSNFSSGK